MTRRDRQWIVLYAVVLLIILIGFRVFPFKTSDYGTQIGEHTNYWRLLIEHGAIINGLFAVIGSLIATVFVAVCLWTFQVIRTKRGCYLLVILAVALNVCALSYCFNGFVLFDGATLSHVETIGFEDRIYHLALGKWYSDAVTNGDYIVYECLSPGFDCAVKAIYDAEQWPDFYMRGIPLPGRFVADYNLRKLYIAVGEQLFQINN